MNPALINLDTGDEYEWRGDGYSHEGDHDFSWSRESLERSGLRLVETSTLEPEQLAALRKRYAAGD